MSRHVAQTESRAKSCTRFECGRTFGLQVFEPVLLLGAARFSNVDIRIRVKGGGFTSQVYGVRFDRFIRPLHPAAPE